MRLFHVGYRQRNGYCEQDHNVTVVLFAEDDQDAVQKADYWLYHESNLQGREDFEFEYAEEVPYNETTQIVYVDEF